MITKSSRLVQSDALIQVKNNLWETAFSVPEDFNEINWAVIDAQQVPITEIQKLVISDNGVLISR